MHEQTHHRLYAGTPNWTPNSALPGGVVWEPPAYPTTRRVGRSQLDKLLLKCNFLVWFVNLAIILPRALV